MKITPVVLLILDGFGYREDITDNAIAQAKKPNWDKLWQQYPHMKLILSGYEDDRWYQEAHDLLDAIVLKGVPDSVCILDPNSADTYETLMFYKNHYGDEPVVIISQDIHLKRALWMADQLGLNAYGYEAGGYPGGIPRWFVIKEIGSRLKARLEIWGWISHQRIVDPLS